MSNKNIIQLTVGPVATNCWIYPIDKGSAAVIDPGDEAQEIIDALKKSSLTLEYILLTHGHFDHIAAVPKLAAAFEPKPQIAIHRLDSHYLGADAYKVHSQSIKAAMGVSSFLDLYWNDVPPCDRFIEEGDTIGTFTVLHLPGHTQGSVAFWDKEEGVIFTGDTLFANGYGRTDLPGGNEEQLFTSLKRLFAMDANIKVYPGHDKTTTIEREAVLY